MHAYFRIFVILAFGLGIILPKASAVLSAALPGQIDRIVICTGAGLQVIEIGPDGEPVKSQTSEGGPCVLTLIATHTPDPLLFWQALARQFTVPVPQQQLRASQTRFPHHNPVRAPPWKPV